MQENLSASRWNAGTLGCFALGCAVVFGTSFAMDIFGIFRNPAGRQLSVQHNERSAKFFLNERYVPTNFDALLIGGSSTSNWPMDAFPFAHFYNESIYGSNTVEEARLVHEAMRTGHFRYAICVITPYMLRSHGLNEGGGLAPRRQAWGSINLLREEFYAEYRRVRHQPSPFWADGGEAMPPSLRQTDPFVEYDFKVDPVAVEAYRQLLDDLRRSGTRLIFVQTAVYEPLYQKHRAQFEGFYSAFPLRHGDEPLLALNAPQYAAFNSEAWRWVDAPHLNDASAAEEAASLNVTIEAMLTTKIAGNAQRE